MDVAKEYEKKILIKLCDAYLSNNITIEELENKLKKKK